MTDAPDPQTQIASLERDLTLYRVLLVVVVIGAILLARQLTGAAYQVSPFGGPGEVWTVDLAERYAKAEANGDAISDAIETYFESDGASVHMHFMGFGQTTPMHLHPHGDEVVIVTGGEAVVRTAWGEGGTPAAGEGRFGPHALIHSPKGCGHEFENPHLDRYLGALVFSMPKFAGNLYVHADDPRLLAGSAPFTYEPAPDLEPFAATGKQVEIRRLPAMGERFVEVLTRGAFTVPANLHKPVLGYVFGGTGTLDGRPLAARTFVHLESDGDKTLQPADGDVLGAILFDPYGALRAVEATTP